MNEIIKVDEQPSNFAELFDQETHDGVTRKIVKLFPETDQIALHCLLTYARNTQNKNLASDIYALILDCIKMKPPCKKGDVLYSNYDFYGNLTSDVFTYIITGISGLIYSVGDITVRDISYFLHGGVETGIVIKANLSDLNRKYFMSEEELNSYNKTKERSAKNSTSRKSKSVSSAIGCNTFIGCLIYEACRRKLDKISVRGILFNYSLMNFVLSKHNLYAAITLDDLEAFAREFNSVFISKIDVNYLYIMPYQNLSNFNYRLSWYFRVNLQEDILKEFERVAEIIFNEKE